MDILEGLWNTTLRYKGVPVNLLGIPRLNTTSYRTTLSRLNKRDYIKKVSDKWFITPSGIKYLNNKRIYNSKFLNRNKKSEKDLLLMFDIPEIRRKERQWFRKHLKQFGFVMLQQSVWVGPSPLPKDFSDFLKEIKLHQCIRTFKLAKPFKK